MILIHYVILVQRLCTENKVHDVILHTSQGFTSLEDCVKHYKKTARKHVFHLFTSDLLSHSVRYILETNNEDDNEDEVVKTDSKYYAEIFNHPAGYVRHEQPLEEIRIRWKVCLTNICKFPHHVHEIKHSTETFLNVRDCILDFWDSDFNRFDPSHEYKVVLEIIC